MTGDFLSLYDHSTRNAGLCTLAEQQAPDRHARAACTQAGGAFHTSPDPVSNGLNL
ncbi:hypothetical protein ECTW09109_0001, partial [Escherichia coli TW09109]